MLTSMSGSPNGLNAVALLLSSFSRQTNPGLRSATTLTRSRFCMKPAMRGSSSAWRGRPMLSCAMWPSDMVLLRRGAHRLVVRVRRILVDALLDLRPEVGDEALDRPGGGVAERADRVALDLFRHVEQHVDLALLRPALRHPGQDPPHPPRAFAAGRALAAALVPVEVGDARDRAHDVGRLVHHDHGRRAEAGAKLAERVEVHRTVDDLRRRHHPHRRAAGDYREQIVPAAPHPAAMLLDQLAERDR